MPTIFIKTDDDQLSYDLAPGADIQSLLPLLAEDIGETEDMIQLYLNGNRMYPGMTLIHCQTYELVIPTVERIVLYAKQREEEWYAEQMNLATEECLPLTRSGSRRYQIRHSEEIRYLYDVPSFVSVMKSRGYSNPTQAEVEQFVVDHIEIFPGDYLFSYDRL